MEQSGPLLGFQKKISASISLGSRSVNTHKYGHFLEDVSHFCSYDPNVLVQGLLWSASLQQSDCDTSLSD